MKGVDLRLCTGWYERLQEDMARGVRNDVSHQSRVQYPGQSDVDGKVMNSRQLLQRLLLLIITTIV